jgi:hypothetical protein
MSTHGDFHFQINVAMWTLEQVSKRQVVEAAPVAHPGNPVGM